MKNLSLAVLVMLLSMFTNSAHAQKAANAIAEDHARSALPEAGTVWHCWYDGITSILCRLGEAISHETVSEPAPPKAPADSRLPGNVSAIWNQAAELAEELITIPLHTPPMDMAFTGELAESVMCGGATTPCGVIFAKNAAVLAKLVNKRNIELAALQPVILAAQGLISTGQPGHGEDI